VIKLLIADDSALMRKLLDEIFREEGDFDIRLARNGTEALELVRSFNPDVVTLDVEMPGMDGLHCLSQIMIESPRPVVMVSALTGEEAEATLEAMELGAVDFIAKPSGAVSLQIDRLRPRLVEKIRGAAKAKIRRTLRLTERVRHQFHGAGIPPRSDRAPRSTRVPASAGVSTGLLLIGTSTGGPAALDIVLPQLPKRFPWPVIVAQHMPAGFTAAFAKRLDRMCELGVVEVHRPMPLQAGTVYIGRGDADVVVSRRPSGLHVIPAPARRDYLWHPSVERMVTSALELYDASKLVGVLMTGMGRDGVDAMTELHRRGGRTLAEAESTAVVWGMPGELVKNGAAALVKPLDEIASAIIAWTKSDAIH
jgi:two-component system, chemotaxis family, protein-glutamate methylesterase/glutaminase